MSSYEFQKIINYVEPVGDFVVVTVTRSWVRFSNEGYMGDASVRLQMNVNPPVKRLFVQIKCFKPITMSFASQLFLHFPKSTPVNPKVRLYVNETRPIKVSYKLSNYGSVNYLLAPKYESSDG